LSAKRSTPCENSRAIHISHHNSRTVTDSEKSSINANRKSTIGIPTSHQPKSCVAHKFPKWVQIPKFVVFCRNFDQKALKVCYKVSLSKNFHWQNCSAINYLSNSINILAGDDPILVEFGHKGTHPQQQRCVFHVSHEARCAVSDGRPSCGSIHSSKPDRKLLPLPQTLA